MMANARVQVRCGAPAEQRRLQRGVRPRNCVTRHYTPIISNTENMEHKLKRKSKSMQA